LSLRRQDLAATLCRRVTEYSGRNNQLAARMPYHALWTGFVRDPDGNLIGLMEEKQ
jgi:hypothetical protein